MPVMLSNNQTAQPNQWIRVELINYNTHQHETFCFLTKELPNQQLHPFSDLLSNIRWNSAKLINPLDITQHDTLILIDDTNSEYLVREATGKPKQLTLF